VDRQVKSNGFQRTGKSTLDRPFYKRLQDIAERLDNESDLDIKQEIRKGNTVNILYDSNH
jgi:predicted DNA-binding ribbon-helix-helix protein